MRIGHLYRNVWKKYSLLRTYENYFVKSLRFSGKGIDLGAKSKDAKYYEYLDLSTVEHMDFVDLFHANQGIVRMDLEQPFPIESEIYDFVISFNVMEHIYNYENLISESCRILKKDGVLHGIVPFMWHYHPDPNDYFRFSWQAIIKILNDNNMGSIVVEPIAYGPFKVAASQIGHVVRFRALRFLVYIVGIFMDQILSCVSSGAENYAMAYYFSGRKSNIGSINNVRNENL